MGLAKNEAMIYLKIAAGKLRKKSNDKDPEAEERLDEINNKTLYERVYSSCTGYLLELREQHHDEYGTQYSMILFDPSDGTKYSLQMSDQSRYFPAMVQRLPFINFALPLTVKPFQFQQDNRTNIGLSFQQDGNKIANYYKKWNDKSKVSTPIHGLENFDFGEAKGDKDELKILRIRLIKFMKKEFAVHNKTLVKYWEENPIPSASQFNSDLPTESDKDESELPEEVPAKKKRKTTKKK